jgi:sarcosine oxidase
VYDVIVLGLGAMGSAAACHLARRGARVLGLEQFTPAHDKGSSHGRSRIIRQAYFEDPAYVPLLVRAYELWGELERTTGMDVLTITGGVMVGRPDSRVVSGSIRSAEEHDLPHEVLDATELRRRFPPFDPADDEIALYEERAGFLVPEDSVRAHLAAAASAGADLRFGAAVVSWRAGRGGATVALTGGDEYEGARLVITPGAWAPKLLVDVGAPMVVERQVMYWFDPLGGTEALSPDVFPIYVWEAPDGMQCYGFPAHDGARGGAKVAFFRNGVETSPETIDRAVSEHEVDEMRAFASARIPALNGPLLQAKTCMYTTTPDEHFVIGRHPGHDNVVIACGFSGHGFKFASVVGEILADLALEGGTDHPIELFDPVRFEAPIARGPRG